MVQISQHTSNKAPQEEKESTTDTRHNEKSCAKNRYVITEIGHVDSLQS